MRRPRSIHLVGVWDFGAPVDEVLDAGLDDEGRPGSALRRQLRNEPMSAWIGPIARGRGGAVERVGRVVDGTKVRWSEEQQQATRGGCRSGCSFWLMLIFGEVGIMAPTRSTTSSNGHVDGVGRDGEGLAGAGLFLLRMGVTMPPGVWSSSPARRYTRERRYRRRRRTRQQAAADETVGGYANGMRATGPSSAWTGANCRGTAWRGSGQASSRPAT